MTTTVTIFSPYIMTGMKLQVVRRDTGPLSEGACRGETILAESLAVNSVFSDHVWDGCEIVIREVKRTKPTIAELDAILQEGDKKVTINSDGSCMELTP